MKKYTKEELYKMDAVDVYKLVLEQKHIKKFPHGFWQQPEALDNAIKCSKYLIEDLLGLSNAELKEQLSRKMFKENSLSGMLDHCFNGSPLKAVLASYPDKFYPWEFKIVSLGYWKDINHGIEATRWLIETKLRLTDEELKEQLSAKLFNNNGLGGMLHHCFNASPIKAIQITYPNKFHPWEFKTVGKKYWNDDQNKITAIRWLVEDKLKLTDDELKEQLSQKMFMDNGLGGMLKICFNSSPIKAIEMAYPGKFNKEDFKNHIYMK